MTLYEQLMYNWERGFYSKLKKKGAYRIASTKVDEGFRLSGDCDSVEECFNTLGSWPYSSKVAIDILYEDGWRLSGTIHPSELMGKGFQAGDKVTVNLKKDTFDGDTGEVLELPKQDNYAVMLRMSNGAIEWYPVWTLKPVLPVVEEKSSATKEAVELLKKHGYEIVKKSN